MELDAFLDQCAKKNAKKKTKRTGFTDAEKAKLGLDLFGGLGEVDPAATAATGVVATETPDLFAPRVAEPSAAVVPNGDETSLPADGDGNKPMEQLTFTVCPITASAKKVKSWGDVKSKRDSEAEKVQANAEGSNPEGDSSASPELEAKPKKFVARGHKNATGALTVNSNGPVKSTGQSTECLPTLEEAFAEGRASPKAPLEMQRTVVPLEETKPEPITAPSTGKYVPPSRAAGSAGAYKPPTSSSAGAYKPPISSSTGAYRPPQKTEEAPQGGAPAATGFAPSAGKYVPSSRAAGSPGAYKPPTSSSAGAYRPPSKR